MEFRYGWWSAGELLACTHTDGYTGGYTADDMLECNAERIVVTSDIYTDKEAMRDIKAAVRRHKKTYRLADVVELSNIQLQHQLPLLCVVLRV